MASLTKDLPPLPPPPPEPSVPQEDPQKSSTGVFRRLTSRLRSPSQSWVHVSSSQPPTDELGCVQEEPPSHKKEKEKHKRKVSTPLLPHAHRKAGGGVELEDAFTSAEQRQAALRAVGLVPANAKPGRDAHGYKVPLSEQEAQLDRQFAVTPEDAGKGEQESEAQKIKEAWLKKNSTNEPGGGLEGSSGTGSGSNGAKASSRSPERTRTQTQTRLSPEPRWESTVVPAVEEPKTVAVAQPQGLMTTDQVRARRKDDPVFAPSGLLAAMQAYRPENYRPPPGRKPSGASAMQQRHRGDADTDSDTSR